MNAHTAGTSTLLSARAESGALALTTSLLARVFSGYRPADYAVRLWNGETIQPATGPPPRFTLVLTHPGALRQMLLPPTELGICEAFVRGDIEIEGDTVAAMGLGDSALQISRSFAEWLGIARDLLRLPGAHSEVERRVPRARLRGELHSRDRDRAAIQYHYDLANEFYALWLDSRMVYSCAYFPSGNESLDAAQEAKLDLICRKVALRPGERLLDIGCGWGGLLTFAAQRYGATGLGVTLSAKQAEFARERVRALGLQGRVCIDLRDYRDLPGETFDKIVSIGMAEHLGSKQMPGYFAQVRRLLARGGLFLNQAIAAQTGISPGNAWTRLFGRTHFFRRYIFPDHDLVPIGTTVSCVEGSGLEVRHVESLRSHYARTARHWVTRLEARGDDALRVVSERTYRAWRLYLAMVAYAFEAMRLNVYQVLLSHADRRS